MKYECNRKGKLDMELACTKSEKMPMQLEPLFEWTANLIVINRNKTLVAVHAASRCAFVLHGLTEKHLKKLSELILNGVRSLLDSKYVWSEIIEQYLNDLGREVSFGANSSRKVVASCNKVCERVQGGLICWNLKICCSRVFFCG